VKLTGDKKWIVYSSESRFSFLKLQRKIMNYKYLNIAKASMSRVKIAATITKPDLDNVENPLVPCVDVQASAALTPTMRPTPPIKALAQENCTASLITFKLRTLENHQLPPSILRIKSARLMEEKEALVLCNSPLIWLRYVLIIR
jgi:hypothetical protein